MVGTFAPFCVFTKAHVNMQALYQMSVWRSGYETLLTLGIHKGHGNITTAEMVAMVAI